MFALSGWDLCGILTLTVEEVGELVEGGDTRWINRGAHDLMGRQPRATRSSAGMPRGRSLYGSIPEQLADETSFLRQLQAILKVRSFYGVATSRQLDIPEVSNRAMLVLVHQLEKPQQRQLTVLNFANEHIRGTVSSQYLAPGAAVSDMFSGKLIDSVDDLRSFTVDMPPLHGMALLVDALPDGEEVVQRRADTLGDR